jgi:hypothetical protein
MIDRRGRLLVVALEAARLRLNVHPLPALSSWLDLTTPSIFKSQYHDAVKLAQVGRFVDKGERAMGERLFLYLHERTP